ncbi:MAG: response regulator [Polyangiales bacterium]
MPSKILVIDDSRMIRRVVASALERAGYAVIEAIDGVDALGALSTEADMRLVVCDLHMPRMDGLQFIEAHKASTAASVPVVLLTTEGYPEEIQRALSLGAKGWLLKPVRPELLVATARGLIAS